MTPVLRPDRRGKGGLADGQDSGRTLGPVGAGPTKQAEATYLHPGIQRGSRRDAGGLHARSVDDLKCTSTVAFAQPTFARREAREGGPKSRHGALGHTADTALQAAPGA